MRTISIKFAVLLLSFLAGSITYAQDSETRNVGSFDGVKVSSGISAELVRGSTNQVDISAEGIDLDKVTTEIKNGVLKVGVETKWWNNWGGRKKSRVKAVITYTDDLSGIAAGSGSSLTSEQTIESDQLDLDVSSGASMDLDIEVDDASIDISSGATLRLSGNAQSTEIDLSSGSNINAYSFTTKRADIDGSSGSTAKIHVVDALVADVSSGASVKYKGNPSKRDIDKSSGGSVRQQ